MRRFIRFPGFLGASLFFALCGCSNPGTTGDVPDLAGSGMPDGGGTELIAARPYTKKIPAAYEAGRSWPLLILLHGYGSNGTQQDFYFGISKIIDSKGFLFAYPEGTKDTLGNQFWN